MTHREREKQAKRIEKAMRRQCKVLRCNTKAFGGHHITCREFSYRLAMADALAEGLSTDQAERYGA